MFRCGANFEGFWYLIAEDARNDIIKKYYLKNIHSIQIQDANFEQNKELEQLLDNSLSIWFDHTVEPYKVKLFISSEVSKYFSRKPISKTQVTEALNEDGSMVVTVEITDDMEIIPLVLYWIPYIRVIEPIEIQQIIEDDLKNYLEDSQEIK